MLKLILGTMIGLALVTNAYSAGTATGKEKAQRKPASDEIKCSENPDSPMDPDYIIKQIESKESCWAAKQMAEACAFGSSMDNQIAGSATQVCESKTGRLNASDTRLKRQMTDRCARACNPQTDGTLCVSRQAFCRLDAAKFMFSVTYKE